MRTVYRAKCFNRPVGPWRTSRERAVNDLIAQNLGSYDEWGHFFITVPGELEWKFEAAQSRVA